MQGHHEAAQIHKIESSLGDLAARPAAATKLTEERACLTKCAWNFPLSRLIGVGKGNHRTDPADGENSEMDQKGRWWADDGGVIRGRVG